MTELAFDSFVLAASTADLADEPAAREVADAIEFRLDLADEPLAALDRYEGELPLIVTNRPEWEGGGTEEGPDRYDALEVAIAHDDVAAVDIELDALSGAVEPVDADRARTLRDRAAERDVAVIASAHDFEATPSADRLLDRLAAAAAAGDVGKLATTATDRDDALALLTATHRATERGETVATMAMGEAGRHTRAVAPVYGSRIGYAPVDPEEATAPGQYDLETLDRLVSSLS